MGTNPMYIANQAFKLKRSVHKTDQAKHDEDPKRRASALLTAGRTRGFGARRVRPSIAIAPAGAVQAVVPAVAVGRHDLRAAFKSVRMASVSSQPPLQLGESGASLRRTSSMASTRAGRAGGRPASPTRLRNTTHRHAPSGHWLSQTAKKQERTW